MVDRVVRVQLVGDASSLVRAATEAASALNRIGGSSSSAGSAAASGASQAQSAWEKFKASVAGQVAIGDLISKGVSGAFDMLKEGITQTIQLGLDYESSMNTLAAVTGGNGDQMKALGDRAKQLGNDITIPGASARTAAAAMAELAKGGLDINETMTAASGTLRLAAAAQIDGAKAAEIQANAMNAFGLGADQADHVADLLANTANAASGEITDMAASLQQSATVAAGFGISVDDTATTLALFAKNGLLGSDAGTSFKTMLTALASPTEAQAKALDELGLRVYDAQGKFVGMEAVTDQLAHAKQRLTVEDYNAAASTAFGTDAIRAANILGKEAATGYEDMADKAQKYGGATEMAAAQSQGLPGALDHLQNSAEAAGLALYERLSPALEAAANFGATAFGWLSDAVGWMGELPAPVWAGVTALGAMILLKGPLNTLFLQAVAGYTRLGVAVRGASFSFAGIATAAKGALAAIGGPFGLAVIGVTTALSIFSSTSDDAAGSADDFTEAINEQTGALNDNAAKVISAKVEASGLGDAYRAIGGNTADLVDALGGIAGKQDLVNKKISEAQAAAKAAGVQVNSYGKVVASTTGATDSLTTSFNNTSAAAAANSTEFLNAQRSGELFAQLSEQLAGKQEDVKNTAEGLTGELDKQRAAVDADGDGFNDVAADMSAYSAQLKAAQDAAQSLTDSTALAGYLGAVKSAADDANRSMDYFRALQDELTGHTRSYNDAVAAQNSNLTALAKAFQDGTKAATENTEAGNLNVDALNTWDVAQLTATTDGQSMYDTLTRLADGHLGTANAAYQAAITEGKTLPDAMSAGRGEADKNRQAFIDLAAQYNGGNREAAEMLADKLGILAGAQIEDKNFQVVAEDQQAQDALRAAQEAVIRDKTFKITALAGVDQASLDAANAKAEAFGFAKTDYAALVAGHADGGWVFGAGGPREDKVRARLSPGEFVVNAAQAAKNAALLEAINEGTMGFADGGLVPGGGSSASAGAAVAVTAPDPTVFQGAWQAIADAARTAWEQSILPVMDAMSARDTEAGTEFTALAQLVQAQQQTVIQPTFTALNAGSEQVGVQAQALRDLWAQAWQANQDRTASVWAVLGGAVFPAMTAALTGLGVSQQQLAVTTDGAWSSIGSRIQGAYDGQIVPAWNGVKSFAGEASGFFAGVQSGIAGATAEITGDISQIRGALDEFFKVVDGRTTPALADGGSVDAAVAAAFADGGMVTAGTGPRADDVLIRVSRGEFVVNAAATALHRDKLEAINNGTPAFADGGFVGDRLRGQVVYGMQDAVGSAVSKVLGALGSSVNVAGFTDSQDPASFGWQRAAGIVPFSWQGHPILGGVAAGTEGVWTSLLNFLVPKIPGGLTEPLYGYENRDNRNSPGRASFHAYGLATDINAGANPNGVPVDARSGLGVIPAGPAREIAARLGMVWGGDFGGTPDSMHFEIHVPPGAIGALGTSALTAAFRPGAGWLGSVLDAIKKAKDAALAPPPSATTGNISYTPSAGVEQWADELVYVLTLLGQNTPANVAAGKLQISTESSGNPNAINLTDSNATVLGTPSKGLVQVIDPTFAAMAKFSPIPLTNIWDPVQNLMAGALWAIHDHGSIAQGWRGVAYDNGGVLPPGFTMAYNGTGHDEQVYTREQMRLNGQPTFDPSTFARAVEQAVTKAVANIGRPGVNVENIHASSAGQVLAEVEFALLRAR